MLRRTGLLAVQVAAKHQPGPSRSGAVGIAIFTVGLGFVCYGIQRMLRARRWRTEAFPASGRVVDNLSLIHI